MKKGDSVKVKKNGKINACFGVLLGESYESKGMFSVQRYNIKGEEMGEPVLIDGKYLEVCDSSKTKPSSPNSKKNKANNLSPLAKNITENLVTYKSIVDGEMKGYEKNLFKSSILNKIKTKHKNKDFETTDKMIDLVLAFQKKHNISVFTPKHSIWKMHSKGVSFATGTMIDKSKEKAEKKSSTSKIALKGIAVEWSESSIEPKTYKSWSSFQSDLKKMDVPPPSSGYIKVKLSVHWVDGSSIIDLRLDLSESKHDLNPNKQSAGEYIYNLGVAGDLVAKLNFEALDFGLKVSPKKPSSTKPTSKKESKPKKKAQPKPVTKKEPKLKDKKEPASKLIDSAVYVGIEAKEGALPVKGLSLMEVCEKLSLKDKYKGVKDKLAHKQRRKPRGLIAFYENYTDPLVVESNSKTYLFFRY